MGSQGSSAPVTVITGELDWDHQADVVVVGTGIAGCATAFNTLEQGTSVLMLEKGETTGGTSAKAGAGILVPNNRFLRKLGQDDPREDFIRFLARVGRPLLYDAGGEFFGLPEWEFRLIETWYDNAAAAFDHMEAAGALRFAHDAGLRYVQRGTGGQAPNWPRGPVRRRCRQRGERPPGHRPAGKPC